METFYTVSELAQVLKISEVWLYRMVREGKIPSVRIAGKTLRFKESEINDWIERGRGQRYYRDKWRETLGQDLHHPNEN